MKTSINPMQRAKRCTANSKRSGKTCTAPAVAGYNVCRMHGAGGGAPGGVRNGNFRTGYWTKEAIEMRRTIAKLIRCSQELIVRTGHHNSGDQRRAARACWRTERL